MMKIKCHANVLRHVQDHDQESTILVRVQLADGGKLKRYSEEYSCQQPEQVCEILLPCMMQAER